MTLSSLNSGRWCHSETKLSLSLRRDDRCGQPLWVDHELRTTKEVRLERLERRGCHFSRGAGTDDYPLSLPHVSERQH